LQGVEALADAIEDDAMDLPGAAPARVERRSTLLLSQVRTIGTLAGNRRAAAVDRLPERA
jgi:hypothetical protein